MRFMSSLLLIVSLAVCYLMFFRTQTAEHSASREDAKTIQSLTVVKDTTPAAAPPRSEYKAYMDRAHAVANQMNASHKEADSF